MQAGDKVQIANLENFLTAFARKVKGKEATIEDIFCRAGSTQPLARVRFAPPHGKRGKAFSELVYLHQLRNVERGEREE